MAASYKILFNRDNRLNKKGEGLIQIEVYFDRRNRKLINTGKHATPDQWSATENQLNRNHKNANKLNQYFRNLINDLENFELDCIRDNKPFNWPILKNYYTTRNTIPVRPLTFNEYCWRELENETKLAPGTIKHNKVSLRLFDNFNKSVRFDELTNSLVKGWDNFLHTKDFKHNTISKHHKVIVKYLNKAIEDERIDFNRNDYPYTRSINKSFKRTRTDFLRHQELLRIEKLELPDGPLNRARNRFLLACYTGLRHSDINQLQKEHLRFYDEGIAIDLQEMYKTKDHVYYPCYQYFEGKAEKFLKLVGGEDFSEFRSYAHDNKYLRVISPDANLNRDITFHLSRHTFLTNLANEVNGNVLKVMRYGGIRNIDTAMIYIHAAEHYYQ